ncbi:hypothetical protein Tco_0776464 [Tanacetum coccineum]
MFQQHQGESLYDAWNRFKNLLRKVPHHGLDLWLQVQIFSDHVNYTTQMAIDDAEELEARILKLIDDQEDQIRQLEEDMRKTNDTFMCLADSLIATLKVKIEAQRVHPTKIEKITRFPTHTPSITPKTLKPTMVHRVSMISKNKPTIYRTPHQHLTSNLKMPILHSFKENKLEYEDEDEVEIKTMGTGTDKESLEHNLYEDNMTQIICHDFSPTSNPPIKPKDSGNFRMKVIFDEKKLGSS